MRRRARGQQGGWIVKTLLGLVLFCVASYGVYWWEERPFVMPTRTVLSFDAETDAEWLPVLAHAPILSVKPFDSQDAYADKFIATLEGGYKVVIKLFHSTTLFPRYLRVINFDENENDGTYRESAGEFQGFPELVAFHVDRVLGFYRKPPVAGRVVPSRLLYRAWWNRLIPSYDVAVTFHGWIDGMTRSDPEADLIQKFMVGSDVLSFPLNATHQEFREHGLKSKGKLLDLPDNNIQTLSDLGSISDVLVFDYLVDDHDRKAEKNWQWWTPSQLKRKILLSWDSGIGWYHGPHGFERCLDILCGCNQWRISLYFKAETLQRPPSMNLPYYDRRLNAISPKKPCHRICRFRSETISLLQSFHLSKTGGKLSDKLRESLFRDPLYPVFHLSSYYSDYGSHRQEVVRYPIESFFQGMDLRVERLLNHVNECALRYDREAVLAL